MKYHEIFKALTGPVKSFLPASARHGSHDLRAVGNPSSLATRHFVLHYSFSVIFFILTTLFLILYTPFAFAQQSIPLIVAPARQEILLDPGEQTSVNVKFLNQGDTPVSGFVKVADFLVDNTD